MSRNARGRSATAAAHATLHVWRVPAWRIPETLWRMAHDRGRLRRLPGVGFAKLLGTGRGHAFGPTRGDPTRWAAVVGWDTAASAREFDATPVARSWRALASAYCRFDLRPVTARGAWAGREPFTPAGPAPAGGPVLALTRARLRPTRAAVFWRDIATVAPTLDSTPGLLAAFGVGEAPIGWQGTISLWRTPRDLVEFVRNPQHRRAVERTPTQRWYAEELFARFAVLDIAGDRGVIGWAEERTVPR